MDMNTAQARYDALLAKLENNEYSTKEEKENLMAEWSKARNEIIRLKGIV
jgi:hypothetical protein